MLRATGGTFPSNLVHVKPHTATNLSDIRAHFGMVQDPKLLRTAEAVLEEMRAGWSNKIQTTTTRFVCTAPVLTPRPLRQLGDCSRLWSRGWIPEGVTAEHTYLTVAADPCVPCREEVKRCIRLRAPG